MYAIDRLAECTPTFRVRNLIEHEALRMPSQAMCARTLVVTLFFLNNPSMPDVSPVTALVFCAIIFAKSNDTLGATEYTAQWQFVGARLELGMLRATLTLTYNAELCEIMCCFVEFVSCVQKSFARYAKVRRAQPRGSASSRHRAVHYTQRSHQPTLRQVPPRAPRPSTHVTFKPSCAALIAHT
jgi:hypothetical protein